MTFRRIDRIVLNKSIGTSLCRNAIKTIYCQVDIFPQEPMKQKDDLHFLGLHEQREVRDHDGEKDRRSGLRVAGRPYRGQAQDGHDRLREPHARRHVINDDDDDDWQKNEMSRTYQKKTSLHSRNIALKLIFRTWKSTWYNSKNIVTFL